MKPSELRPHLSPTVYSSPTLHLAHLTNVPLHILLCHSWQNCLMKFHSFGEELQTTVSLCNSPPLLVSTLSVFTPFLFMLTFHNHIETCAAMHMICS